MLFCWVEGTENILILVSGEQEELYHRSQRSTCQASGCRGRCCPRGLSSSLSSPQTHRSALAACRWPATELRKWNKSWIGRKKSKRTCCSWALFSLSLSIWFASSVSASDSFAFFGATILITLEREQWEVRAKWHCPNRSPPPPLSPTHSH